MNTPRNAFVADCMAGLPLNAALAPTIIAIPACNEEQRIGDCLAALAVQRDACGRRIPLECYRLLLYANNCSDATSSMAAQVQAGTGLCLEILEAVRDEERFAAGLARKTVMDMAADRLEASGAAGGLIMTTDADSMVSPTWLANSWRAFASGADCVAGYVDADPREYTALGRDFQNRGFAEEHYHALVAEAFALLDPRPHDPWPNHQVSSGASLAITLKMYRKIGGLPATASGEDSGLVLAVECQAGKVRHAMDVCVTTSCRLEGRAVGGAADAMRHRHAVCDAPCDQELEPIAKVIRKARLKGFLRRSIATDQLRAVQILAEFGASEATSQALLALYRQSCFEVFWQRLCAAFGPLRYGAPLRPSALGAEIAKAEAIIHRLRTQTNSLQSIDVLVKDDVVVETRLHGL